MNSSPLAAGRALTPSLVNWRHRLHANPETAFQEHETAQFVAAQLAEFGLDEIITGFGRTGVVAALRNGAGPSIGLRADMDALPIQEENDFAHRSQNPGRMHACGHDGHTTMLLGAARLLAERRNFRGVVYFVFQPAEENEGGARVMTEAGLFDRFPMDAIYGLHNWPGLAEGEIALHAGPMMAAFDMFEIDVIGRGGHAAMPQYGVDPILIAAELVGALQKLVSRMDPLDSAVLSVTQFHAGDAYNVIPERATLKGGIRSLSPATQDRMERELRRLATGLCEANGARAEVRYERRYPPTLNAPAETELAGRAARDVVGATRVHTNLPPSMGSEDFAFFLQQRPGCYIWLGAGDRPGSCMLHNPRYDFNDQILPIGVAYWLRLVELALPV
jgi:amidohydrolase